MTVSRSSACAGRADLVAQAGDQPLRLVAGRADSLVAFAPGAPSLLLGRPQRLGRRGLGGAGPVEAVARLALGRLDRGEGLLERPLRSRSGASGRRRRSASGRPSRSAMAKAWLPPGRPIVSR